MAQKKIPANEKIAFSIAELATALSVSENLIRKEITLGRLPSTNVGKRRVILRSDLDRYLERRKNMRRA